MKLQIEQQGKLRKKRKKIIKIRAQISETENKENQPSPKLAI